MLIPVSYADAAGTATATFAFSSRSIEVKQADSANLCAADSTRGETLSYQEAFGTQRKWKAIFQRKLARANQCFTYKFGEKSLGQYQFRLELESQGRKVALTGIKRLEVFGPVSLLQFQNSVGFGCGNNNPVSSGGHLYQTFCDYGNPAQSQSGARSSCRSMTVSFIATDDKSGVNPDAGTATVQIQQSTLNPQNFTFADNTLTAENIQLDGSQFQLNFSDSNASSYEGLYLVSSGTADCYTLTGAV